MPREPVCEWNAAVKDVKFIWVPCSKTTDAILLHPITLYQLLGRFDIVRMYSSQLSSHIFQNNNENQCNIVIECFILPLRLSSVWIVWLLSLSSQKHSLSSFGRTTCQELFFVMTDHFSVWVLLVPTFYQDEERRKSDLRIIVGEKMMNMYPHNCFLFKLSLLRRYPSC